MKTTLCLIFVFLSLPFSSFADATREQYLIAREEAQRRILILQNANAIAEVTINGKAAALWNIFDQKQDNLKRLGQVEAQITDLSSRWKKLTDSSMTNTEPSCVRFSEASNNLLKQFPLMIYDFRRWLPYDSSIVFMLQGRLEALNFFVLQMNLLLQSEAEGGYSMLLGLPKKCFADELRAEALQASDTAVTLSQKLSELINGVEGLGTNGHFYKRFKNQQTSFASRQDSSKVMIASAQVISTIAFSELFIGKALIGTLSRFTSSAAVLRASSYAGRATMNGVMFSQKAIEYQKQASRKLVLDNLWAAFVSSSDILGHDVMEMDLSFLEQLLKSQVEQRNEFLKKTYDDLKNQIEWSQKYGGRTQAIQHLQSKIEMIDAKLAVP